MRTKKQQYRVTAPETPGAVASVIEQGLTLSGARRVAHAYHVRRDLTYQDVRIERLDGRLREYAGPAR